MLGWLSRTARRASRWKRAKVGGLCLGRRQHLDGDDLAKAMLGLENAGHTADAETVEQLVLIEEERPGPAAQQDAGLVFGEILVGGEPAGVILGVGAGAVLSSRAWLGRTDPPRQQPAAVEKGVKLLYRTGWHGSRLRAVTGLVSPDAQGGWKNNEASVHKRSQYRKGRPSPYPFAPLTLPSVYFTPIRLRGNP